MNFRFSIFLNFSAILKERSGKCDDWRGNGLGENLVGVEMNVLIEILKKQAFIRVFSTPV